MPPTLSPLLFAVVGALAQDAPGPASVPDTVSLTFNWPASLRARIEGRGVRARLSRGKRDTLVAHVSYRMDVAREGDEYVVRFDDFRVLGPAHVAAHDSAEAIAARFATYVPGYRVNKEGDFVRIEGVEGVRAFIDSLHATLERQNPEAAATVAHLLTTLKSEGVLTASAEENWNALVGAWVGARMVVGQVYETESEEPVAMLQGTSVRYKYQFTVLRRLSCDSVAAPHARDCVELQQVSVMDTLALRRFFRDFAKEFFPDSASRPEPRLEAKFTTTLVARPESMLPVSLVLVKDVSGTEVQDGKLVETQHFELKLQEFTYCASVKDPCVASSR